MALIKCNECGREVSEKAASCPNCGNPIYKGVPKSEQSASGLFMILGLIFPPVGYIAMAVAFVNSKSRAAKSYLIFSTIGLAIHIFIMATMG